ncbi:hypothetical protein CL622_03330 [archaeon]|nr:hypothetical protein [archaeon]
MAFILDNLFPIAIVILGILFIIFPLKFRFMMWFWEKLYSRRLNDTMTKWGFRFLGICLLVVLLVSLLI